MMKKRGFTLIELLAVIVILALIAVISVPLILNVINDSKKSALKDSAYGMIESANLFYARNPEKISDSLLFSCIDSNCKTSDNLSLSFKGEIESGTINLLSSGKVQICIQNNEFAATNYIDSIVSNEVVVKDGTCDGINIISSSETLIKNYEKQLLDQKESYESQLLTQKENYEAQISNLQAIAVDTTDATAIDMDILTGKTAYVNKQKIVGTGKGFIGSGLFNTLYGTTYTTVPVGYYSNYVSVANNVFTFNKAGTVRVCTTSKAHSAVASQSYARLYKNGVAIYQINASEINRCDSVTVAVNDTMYYQIASGAVYGVGSFWMFFE